MKQILIRIDDRTADLLESIVPARSGKRSEFIRRAIAQALLEVAEPPDARRVRSISR